MGYRSIHHTQNTADKHLRAFSLLEAVLAITILGITLVVVGVLLAQMMEAFRVGGDESRERNRLHVPLMQILREFSAADPAAVILAQTSSDPSVRFSQVSASGMVQSIHGNEIIVHTPADSTIVTGQRVRFLHSAQEPLQILSVSGTRLVLEREVEGSPVSFVVHESMVEIDLQNSSVVMTRTRYQAGGDSVTTGDLVGGIAQFQITSLGEQGYRIVLETDGSGGRAVVREERTWAFH